MKQSCPSSTMWRHLLHYLLPKKSSFAQELFLGCLQAKFLCRPKIGWRGHVMFSSNTHTTALIYVLWCHIVCSLSRLNFVYRVVSTTKLLFSYYGFRSICKTKLCFETCHENGLSTGGNNTWVFLPGRKILGPHPTFLGDLSFMQ